LITNKLVNALRFLSADAVERANSGHPGMPLGMADIAEVLWRKHLNHSPENPKWFNRDRFVLSNGHGSMLIYSLLHLSGYNLSIDDLKDFRKLKSKTPGHPEFGITEGVETTTGPLGQGIANAVGMAMAEKILAKKINTKDIKPIDHMTYCFLGDGCLMEGVSHEAMSLAGVLQLNKLICFYDSNGISIDGKIDGWYKDDISKRCEAYGWNVINDIDGHNRDEIDHAIEQAKKSVKPTMIVCNTSIGYGAGAKQDSESSHGAALGPEILAELRKNLAWPYEPFELDDDIYQSWDARAEGNAKEEEWNNLCEQLKRDEPRNYELLKRLSSDKLPDEFDLKFNGFLKELEQNESALATRKSSQIVLEFLQENLPELIGGSADLSGSNNTISKSSVALNENADGNYIYYGVREFGMNAVMNGMSLHGGVIPYAGTFLVFMDYGRNAVRMAALMGIRVIFVFSHDSVALGEDGPTHQPIEHLTTLRSTPNMHTWRPSTLLETAIAWKNALANKQGPSSIILSRQNLENFTVSDLNELDLGGYFISQDTKAKINLIATGSEVSLAIQTEKILREEGIVCNVASIPCLETLLENKDQYKKIFNKDKINIVIECAHPNSWYKHTKNVIGIETFGESGSGDDLMNHFGFTPNKIAQKVKKLV
jgi:transketolase